MSDSTHDDTNMSMHTDVYDISLPTVKLSQDDEEFLESVQDLHATRDTERRELEKLNQRFERYIAKIKAHKDSEASWQHRYTDMHKKYKRDVALLQKMYDGQILKLDNEVKDEKNMNQDLKSNFAALKVDFDNLTEEIRRERDFIHQLQDRSDTLSNTLLETKSELLTVTETARLTARDLELDRASLDLARAEVDFVTGKAENLESEVSQLSARLVAAENTIVSLKVSHSKEMEHVNRQLVAQRRDSDESSDALRRDYINEMNKVFEERYAQSVRDKDAAVAALTEEYNDKMKGYRDSLNELGHRLETERNKANAAVNDLEHVLLESEELQAINKGLEARINDLNDLIDRIRDGESQLLKEKNEDIRNIKAAFSKKDQEFDELMGIKIDIAMELQTLNALLGSEEDRLNYRPSEADSTASLLEDKPLPRFGSFGAPLNSGSLSNAQNQSEVPAKRARTNMDDDEDLENQPRGIIGSFMNLIGKTPSKTPSKRVKSMPVTSIPLPLQTPNSKSVSPMSDDDGEIVIGLQSDEVPVEPTEVAPTEGEATDAVDAPTSEAPVEPTPVKSSKKKSKKQKKDVPAVVSESVDEPTEDSSLTEVSSSLLVSGRDEKGQYVTIVNGLDSPVSLDGWSLQTLVNKYVFEFPPGAELSPGESFTIKTADDGSLLNDDDVGEDGVVWLPRTIWADEGDECLLINPDGDIKARVEVVSQVGVTTA